MTHAFPGRALVLFGVMGVTFSLLILGVARAADDNADTQPATVQQKPADGLQQIRQRLTAHLWHGQHVRGLKLPAEQHWTLRFKADGTYALQRPGDDKPVTGSYELHPRRGLLLHYENKRAQPRLSFPSLATGHHLLLLRHENGPWVFARERAMRDAATRVLRADGVRQGITAQARRQPTTQRGPDIGALVTAHRLPVRLVLRPGEAAQVPDGFNDWSKQKQRTWVNAHSPFVAVTGPGDYESDKVMLFELPRGEQKQITVAFQDGHVQLMPVERAGKLIREQTGRSIDAWRKARADTSDAESP